MHPLVSLPSLNALRAFEAVARHLSFAKAAEELHVTPGAISHQITALEATLGIPLFHRDGRRVALTAAAEASLPSLTRGFDALREALRVLQAERRDGTLTVHVAPAFATRWLLPRLPAFAARHPDIALRLSTGLGLIDALRSTASSPGGPAEHGGASADVTIRFGRGGYVGTRSERLFNTSVTPVCSPRLLRGRRPLREPADLRDHLLLHDDTVYFDDDRADWDVWLEAAGVSGVDAARGPRFSHTGLALDAAADGLGVALGIPLLTAADVADGRLVTPFALALPSHFAYYLVTPQAGIGSPELAAFRGWLLDEARAGESRVAAPA